MTPRAIEASFWRGGTSRGLILRAQHVAPFTSTVRDQIIRTAMGSPDPDARQISGLGGGVSSLSKAMIVGTPGEGKGLLGYNSLPGPSWSDDGSKVGFGQWDIVYRFAQVGVKHDTIDWSATCGNMVAAVALHAISTPILPYTTMFQRALLLRQQQQDKDDIDKPLMFPLSILSTSNSTILKANVPINPITLQPWIPEPGQGLQIAGVPERGAGIQIETPLESSDQASNPLVTGNVMDTIEFQDKQVQVTILSAGLINIFIDMTSFNDVDESTIGLPSSKLTSHSTLLSSIEQLRQLVCTKFNIPCSLSSPKVTCIGQIPLQGFTSSNGQTVEPEDADLVARAVSSGDWHRTIPGTTLAALNVALGIQGTVVSDLVSQRRIKPKLTTGSDEERDVTIRAAHEAGVTDSTVRFKHGQPKSVVLWRTAREIMRGSVLIPENVFHM
ncbi:hypothetical protein OIO90_002149 [Microbotryomycetes sp. JL221]|nr:hypothetical protein OIO90_002149 [Microbotryomycetes sp. JL221]